MPQILRTVLSPDTARTVDGASISHDLPVNPLSMILFTIMVDNLTTTPSNYRSFNSIIDAITSLSVSYRGANILDGDLLDLAVMTAILTGMQPQQSNMNSANNDKRAITIPLIFGRTPYDPLECFPATRRGDLILSYDVDIADTGYDTLFTQIETVELLDAAPTQFIKQTTTSKVMDQAGDIDVELPIGNDLLGVLLRSFAVPNTTFTSSMGQVALQVDNVETIYSKTNWESLHGDLGRRIPNWKYDSHVHHMAEHIHLMNLADSGLAAYSATRNVSLSANADDSALANDGNAVTGITGIQAPAITHTLEQEDDASALETFAFLDMDPLKDGQYALKTEGAGRVNLVVSSDQDDGAGNNSKFMPVELVKLEGAGVVAG